MPILVDDVRLSYLRALMLDDAVEARAVRDHRDYYSGEHPTYLTDRQKEFLGLKVDYKFRANLCSVVVDTPAERLQVQAFDGGQDEAGQQMAALAWEWWTANRMDGQQDDLHTAAIRDDEAYLIVDWLDDEARPRWTVNYKYDGTRGVKIHRHPDTGEVIFASKRWFEDNPTAPGQTGKPRLTLYFADRVERYRANEKLADGWEPVTVNEAGVEVAWPTPWVGADREPLGVAAVPFTNPGGAEIRDAVPIQDMYNKSLLDLIAAADTDGFGLLYATGVQATDDEITVRPGKLVKFTNVSSRLDRSAPADLTRLIEAADSWVVVMAGVTRTPQYLFQRWGQTPPSGESLKQQEVGLLAKVRRKQTKFGNAYEDVVALSARLQSIYGETLSEIVPVSTVWKPAAIRDELAHLNELEAKGRLGVPQEQLWIEAGYDQEQVDRFKALREASRDQAMGTMVRQIITARQEEEAEGAAES